jgi:hypothetical protein
LLWVQLTGPALKLMPYCKLTVGTYEAEVELVTNPNCACPGVPFTVALPTGNPYSTVAVVSWPSARGAPEPARKARATRAAARRRALAIRARLVLFNRVVIVSLLIFFLRLLDRS